MHSSLCILLLQHLLSLAMAAREHQRLTATAESIEEQLGGIRIQLEDFTKCICTINRNIEELDVRTRHIASDVQWIMNEIRRWSAAVRLDGSVALGDNVAPEEIVASDAIVVPDEIVAPETAASSADAVIDLSLIHI